MADNVSLNASILGNEIVTAEIPWAQGMTILSAMEAVHDFGQVANFTFQIGYFNQSLGYLLFEVNQVGDQPCVYWDVQINGKPPQSGLDKDQLNPGDAVTLTYAWCGQNEAQNSPMIAAKFELERQNPALEIQA